MVSDPVGKQNQNSQNINVHYSQIFKYIMTINSTIATFVGSINFLHIASSKPPFTSNPILLLLFLYCGHIHIKISLNQIVNFCCLALFFIIIIMGSAISADNKLAKGDLIAFSSSSCTGLGDLPESCISCVFMNLEPQDICKLARVNKTFHRASSADFVWESKLPSSFKFLLNQVLCEDDEQQNLKGSFTKKQIYATLCRPNRFHSGSKVSVCVCVCVAFFFS